MNLIEKEIGKIFEDTIKKLYPEAEGIKNIDVQAASNEKFGDFQTNFAMVNAKVLRNNPRAIATELVENICEKQYNRKT